MFPGSKRRFRLRTALSSAGLAGVVLIAAPACRPTDPHWRMTLVGASVGGAWSSIGEAITDELRKGIPRSSFTLEPGQDGANAVVVHRGRVEMALIHSSLARAALGGFPPFDEAYPDVRAVTLVYADTPFHFVVTKRTGLRSIDDIRERRYPLRIGVNTRGSLMELGTLTALEAYGLDFARIEEYGGFVVSFPLAATYDMMKDGRMDGTGTTVQVPQQQMIETNRSVALDILPLSSEAIAFCNERLGTEAVVIPKDAYPFLDRDIPTFAGRVILITNRHVPDRQIYELTRVIHDALPRLHRVHRALAPLTPATMPKVGGIPLHPGAQKFYREIGVL